MQGKSDTPEEANVNKCDIFCTDGKTAWTTRKNLQLFEFHDIVGRHVQVVKLMEFIQKTFGNSAFICFRSTR
jgi:hypothetical protein